MRAVTDPTRPGRKANERKGSGSGYSRVSSIVFGPHSSETCMRFDHLIIPSVPILANVTLRGGNQMDLRPINGTRSGHADKLACGGLKNFPCQRPVILSHLINRLISLPKKHLDPHSRFLSGPFPNLACCRSTEGSLSFGSHDLSDLFQELSCQVSCCIQDLARGLGTQT